MHDLNALWYDTEGTWDAVHAQAKDLTTSRSVNS